MSSCKFTLKDENGNVIVNSVSEQAFKKYLAQEGLSEYINSGEIKINMDFLKEFIVTPKEKTTKKIISESTGAKNKPKQTPLREARKEGKYEGELKTTEKLSKQIDEAKAKLQSFRDDVKEKFAEYSKFQTEKAKKALADARQRFNEKINEVRELGKERSKQKIDNLKERVKENILNIKEKGQALTDITNGLREEIKLQLRDAKADIFKGAKVSGLLVKRMLDRVNNAKTPLQLLSAVDYISKSLQDIDYGNKLNTAKKLSDTVKRLAKSAPSNIKAALNQLANVKPREIADVNAYNETLNDVIDFLKSNSPDGINTQKLNDLTESITKNNLIYKIDLAENLLVNRATADDVKILNDKRKAELQAATTPQEKKIINDDYDQRIKDLKDNFRSSINKPMAGSLSDMQNALDDLQQQAEELTPDEDGYDVKDDGKRNALESINEILREDLDNFDTSGIDPQDLKFVEALRSIDITKLSNKQLAFLNFAINNLVENGRLDGVGKLYNIYRVSQEFTPAIINFLKSGVLKINALKDRIWDRASLDTQLNLIFSNEGFIAKLRTAAGLGDWFNSFGSEKGYFGQTNKNLRDVFDLLKKTGIDKSPESQIKIGAIIDITQHDMGLTPIEIQAEFEGRKEAMLESIRRGKEAMKVSRWNKENGEYVNMVELVYNKYIKDADNPNDVLKKLTKGEKELRDLILSKYDNIQDGQRRLSEIYENKKFKNIVNYSARTYIGTTDAVINEGFAEGLGGNAMAANNAPGLSKSQSTAFEDRKLKGKQIRKNSMVNYNILDSFQNEYRKQMYDLYTYDKRQYVAQASTSPEILEAFNGDAYVLSKFQQSLENRYLNEISSLHTARNSGTLLSDIGNLLKGNAIRSALGGVALPYIKQFAPTMASVLVNTSDNPALFWTSISDMTRNGDAFKRLTANSPVSQRHEQEIATTGGIITAKDMKKVSSMLRRKVKGLDDFSDKVLMSALKSGDLSSAGLAWVTYYKKSLLMQGKIKSYTEFDLNDEANNPDMEAMQYAEQMTATTLNINEAVNKPVDSTIPLLGKSLPFTTFAINSKINLASNIGKLIESGGVVSAKDRLAALQRIGAHVAESATINAVGWMMRSVAIGTAYQVFAYALNSSDMDEEEKDKSLAVLNKTFETVLESNDKNSGSYFVNDLLFGQIAENIATPAVKAIKSAGTDIYLAASGKQKEKKPFEYANDYAPVLAFLGASGMVISNTITAGKNLESLITYNNDDLFRMNKFGFIDAYGEKKIPLDEQTTKVPAFNQYMQSAAVISNALTLFTGSPKEIQIFTSRIPQVNKKMITEIYGKDKTLQSEKERYESMEVEEVDGKKYYLKDKFSVVNFGGNEYILTVEQLEERKANKAEMLNLVYGKMMESYMPAIKKQRDMFKDISKQDKKYSFLKDQADLMKYPDKYTNDQITDIVNSTSEGYIVAKYANKLTLKKDVE
jgi:hypothetical protein